jgi:type II secretory pathway component PulL
MTEPLRFPDPMEEARQRALEFQRLTPDQRWRELAAMMSFGLAIVRSSAEREAQERRMNEQEERSRQIQQELFARHGR